MDHDYFTATSKKHTNSCVLCGYNPQEECSYMRFPSKRERTETWLSVCKLPLNTNVSSSRLCSKHFRPEDFSAQATKRPRLKGDAVPSIFFDVDNVPNEKKSSSYCIICKKRTTEPMARFPRKELQRNVWMQHFSIPVETEVKNAYVCAKHFSFENTGSHRRSSKIFREDEEQPTEELLSNNVNEIESSALNTAESSYSSPTSSRAAPTSTQSNECFLPPITPVTSPKISEAIPISTQPNESFLQPMTPVTGAPNSKSNNKSRVLFPRYPADIRTPHLETPRRAKRCVELTRSVIHKQKSQITALQKKLYRARKKISNLEDIVTKLRNENLINEDMKQTLMDIMPPVVAEMAYRKLRNKKEKFSLELRKFAMTLQFYSPKGYSYVRKTFSNLLPHPATIRQWCCTQDGQPGFSKEVMETIQNAHTSTKNSKPIVCNLVIDEMSIRQNVQVRNNRTYGFVDLGFTDDNEDAEGLGTPPTAKQALVFLIVSLNDSWKCPCGYFLIDSLTSEQRAGLIKKCLGLLSEHNINVHSLTFDGQQVNMSTVKVLGGNLDFHSKYYQPYFFHPRTAEKVFVFPDPSHMLKNVRNAFGKYGSMLDGENKKILWWYIARLVDIQENEIGLHVANKLTKRHINFKQNIMNVKLATQTLSNSTKDALLYMRRTKTYRKEFIDVDGTATFCKTINDAFDVLNCRSRFHKRYETHKIPLCAKTKDQLKEKVDNIIKYIRALKMPDGTPITKSDRKCGFVGFIVCLENIFHLWDDLQKYEVKYLLTYKLLQDHIENFFCAVRIKGGFNNNPDAFQFRCAYRRLLMHHEVTSSNSANCEPDKIPILTVTYKRNQKTITFDEAILYNYEWFNFEDVVEIPTEVLLDVIHYIGGYIVMKIESKKSVNMCPLCLDMLQNKASTSTLIEVKDRGGLKEPTQEIVNICLAIETIIRKNNDKIFLPGFIESTMAKVLLDHRLSGAPGHGVHDKFLTELVAQFYLKLRLRHEAKLMSEVDHYIRRTFTKLITHKHQ